VPSVCIVVLNWNRPADTIECLESVLPSVRAGLATVAVCDNASGDDSQARLYRWAERHFDLSGCPCPAMGARRIEAPLEPSPAFVLIQNGCNGGYAAGNNSGLRYALAQRGYEFAWILNNDTVVAPDALRHLLSCAAERPQAAVLGSTIVCHQDRATVECAGGSRYHPVGMLVSPVLAQKSLAQVFDWPTEPRLDYVSGAAMLLLLAALRKVGLFDEDFFLYGEELDLSMRLRRRAYTQAWCRRSIVYHKGAVSTRAKSRTGRRESWTAAYHENLSALKLTVRHFPGWLVPAAAVRLLGKGVICTLQRRGVALRALGQAYRDFFGVRRSPPLGPRVPEPALIATGHVRH